VQGAERRVAVAHRVDQDAHAHQVVDVGEVAAADDHLLVDRVVVLRPAGDGGLDLRAAQVGADLLAHDREVLLAGGGALGHQVHDLVVHLRVERLEGQVLQLPLDRVHAQPVGQRGVDLQRLAGLLLGRRRRHELPGAGVVQPVGELDDEHPDVARHRDDHLAHRLGLRRVAVGDLVELGHAVDEHRDLGPVLGAQLLQRVRGVLDRVVQQRRGERRRRHAELGQDRRHRDRVRDVRVAALAQLPAVRLLRGRVRALEQAQVGLGVVGPDGLQQRLDHRRLAAHRASLPEPRQARAHPARGTRARGRLRPRATGSRGPDLVRHARLLTCRVTPGWCHRPPGTGGTDR